MTWLFIIKTYWRPLAVALALLAVAASIGWYGHSKYKAGYAQAQAETAQIVADGQALARAAEQRRWMAREGIINDAKTQTAAALADADRARAASERLRKQYAELQRRARDSTTAGGGQGQSGADTLDLLIRLLSGLDEVGRDVSGYADRLKVAGSACERGYDSLP